MEPQGGVVHGAHGSYKWSALGRLQRGRFGEHFAKMEFAMHGFEIYTADVDDRGIDFVARRDGGEFLEIQVKTVSDYNLQFVNESKFKRTDRFVVCLVRLQEGTAPQVYAFRGTDWPNQEGRIDNGLLGYNRYEGKSSNAAYEIHLAKSRDELLQDYSLTALIDRMSA